MRAFEIGNEHADAALDSIAAGNRGDVWGWRVARARMRWAAIRLAYHDAEHAVRAARVTGVAPAASAVLHQIKRAVS